MENPEDIVKAEAAPDDGKLAAVENELHELRSELTALRDLFSRRLMNDKQKAELIQTLTAGANFACIEPFLYDLILLLDRIDGSDDELVQSVQEELMEILERRGVEKIEVASEFDPRLCKAVRVVESEDAGAMRIGGVLRSGYTFAGRVVRPAEVVVIKPKKPDEPEESTVQ